MAVLTPHFDLPFRFGAYAEQSTPADLANCVFAICVCPKGFRDEALYFGIEDPTFSIPPVMTEDVRTSIAEQEPRAELLFSEKAGMDQLERLVKIYIEGS